MVGMQLISSFPVLISLKNMPLREFLDFCTFQSNNFLLLYYSTYETHTSLYKKSCSCSLQCDSSCHHRFAISSFRAEVCSILDLHQVTNYFDLIEHLQQHIFRWWNIHVSTCACIHHSSSWLQHGDMIETQYQTDRYREKLIRFYQVFSGEDHVLIISYYYYHRKQDSYENWLPHTVLMDCNQLWCEI